jgi:hypothetical protein
MPDAGSGCTTTSVMTIQKRLLETDYSKPEPMPESSLAAKTGGLDQGPGWRPFFLRSTR